MNLVLWTVIRREAAGEWRVLVTEVAKCPDRPGSVLRLGSWDISIAFHCMYLISKFEPKIYSCLKVDFTDSLKLS